MEAGLRVAPYIKTSLSPGSGVVTHYLQHSGVTPFLTKLGFDIVGYGCMTCIGNSGPIPESIVEAIEKVTFSEGNINVLGFFMIFFLCVKIQLYFCIDIHLQK